MPKQTWTERDYRRLARLYPIASHEDLMIAFPGRKLKSQICAAAKRRGIKRAFPSIPSHSLENRVPIRAFKELYPYFPNTAMARMFGMDYRAVKNAAHRLNLSKAYDYNIGQYRKGMDPWNKGTKGIMQPNSGCFEKGHLPANTKHDGAVTIRKDKRGVPYKFIRISQGVWEAMHTFLWKEHHGQVPKGHVIRYINGDTLDARIENLECVPRSEHAIRNAPWKTGNFTDKFCASLIAGKNSRDLIPEILEEKDLIEVKRKQLQLNQQIREHETRRNEKVA